jgi:hypothetical protein
MKHIDILVSLMMLTVATTAVLAAVDPQPDGVGVFFDTEASALCHPPGSRVDCYLMLTNLTGSTVMGWTCAVDIDTNLQAVSLGQWSLYGGIDVSGTPEDPATLVKRFVVGTGPYEPIDGNMIVATRTMFPMSSTDEVSFRIFPTPDYTGPCTLCYVHTLGIITPLHVVNGNTDVPQTFITSGDCVVENEDITWSQLKALY